MELDKMVCDPEFGASGLLLLIVTNLWLEAASISVNLIAFKKILSFATNTSIPVALGKNI